MIKIQNNNKGRVKTITTPNGIQSFMEYDAYTGQVKVAGHRRTNGALIYSDTFAYYPNSQLYQSITRKTLTDTKTTQYTYDAYERVLTVTEADGRRTAYEYDAFGNRTKETITNINNPSATGGSPKAYGTYVYEYTSGSNRLNRILFNGTAQETFLYDNAGRMTTRTYGTVTTTYTYDDRGLLTAMNKTGTAVSFTYDALGVRKTKTVNGVTTRYLTAPIFGMSHVLGELDTSMAFKATYVYAGHQQLKEEPVATDRTKDLYLLHDGIVGSTTHAIDPNGSIRNEYKYDAFGIRTQQSAANTGSLKNYGYTGEEYDQETGLVYLRARYYDPTLGRFISADPYLGRIEEPVTQNRYIYVQNNPLMYTDPSGLDGMVDIDISFGMQAGFTTKVGPFKFSPNIDFGTEHQSISNPNGFVTQGGGFPLSIGNFTAGPDFSRSVEGLPAYGQSSISTMLSGEKFEGGFFYSISNPNGSNIKGSAEYENNEFVFGDNYIGIGYQLPLLPSVSISVNLTEVGRNLGGVLFDIFNNDASKYGAVCPK